MLGSFLTFVIGVVHVAIMVMEMGFWTHERVRTAFGTTPEFASATRVLAANQGLYNGFLAAGLFWGAWSLAEGKSIAIFFLTCVAIAGAFGAITASRRIIFVQTLPAVIALAAVVLS